MWSNHLNRQLLSPIIWVFMNQAWYSLSFPHTFSPSCSKESFLFLSKQSRARIREGGFPSRSSLAIKAGQLHKSSLSAPRFCYLGIHPSRLVSNQFLMILRVSSGSSRIMTQLWNPSSQRKPQGNLFREGVNDNRDWGSLAIGVFPCINCRLPYSKLSPRLSLSTASLLQVTSFVSIAYNLFTLSKFSINIFLKSSNFKDLSFYDNRTSSI